MRWAYIHHQEILQETLRWFSTRIKILSFTKIFYKSSHFVILVEVFCGKPFGKQARLLLKPVFVTLQAQAVIKCITREKNLACEMRKAEDWYHLTAMQRQEHSYTVLSQSWCLINSFSHVASFCISLLFFSSSLPSPTSCSVSDLRSQA